MILNPDMIEAEGQALLDRLTDYCLERGGVCYRDWPREVLKGYISFHAKQDTFAFIRWKGAIVGTGVAYQIPQSAIEAAALSDRQPFKWQPNDLGADAVFAADFVTSRPGALGCLLKHFLDRFPHWERLSWSTFRGSKLVRLNPALAKHYLKE